MRTTPEFEARVLAWADKREEVEFYNERHAPARRHPDEESNTDEAFDLLRELSCT